MYLHVTCVQLFCHFYTMWTNSNDNHFGWLFIQTYFLRKILCLCSIFSTNGQFSKSKTPIWFANFLTEIDLVVVNTNIAYNHCHFLRLECSAMVFVVSLNIFLQCLHLKRPSERWYKSVEPHWQVGVSFQRICFQSSFSWSTMYFIFSFIVSYWISVQN